MKPNSRAPRTTDPSPRKSPISGEADADALQQRVHAAFADCLPHSDAPIGVAVSGGSDSLCLLYLANAWARNTGRRICAVTVDHGLRPEAAAEARWVASICAGLNIPHQTLKWSHAAAASPAGAVGQASARQARHDLLAQWAATHRVSHILLGHTQDDAVETCLMRMRAGSRWYGLAALQPRSASPAWPYGLGLTLVRPLLQVTRAQLRKWLTAREMTWVDDPSNENTAYERIRMRQLAPRLSSDVIAGFPRMLDQLSALRRAQTSVLLAHLTTNVIWRNDGAASMKTDWLNALPHALCDRMLGLVAMCVSGAPTPLRAAHAAALRRLAANPRDNATFMAGNAWTVVMGDMLTIYRRPQGEARSSGAPDLATQTLTPGNSMIWDGRFKLSLSPAADFSGDIVCLDHARRLSADLPPTPRDALPRARRMLPVLLTDNSKGYFPVLGASHDPDTAFAATPLSCARIRHLLSCEL